MEGIGSGIGVLGGHVGDQIIGGGLAGGIGSSIAGGNFFHGMSQGLMVGGLNHAAHQGIQGIGPDPGDGIGLSMDHPTVQNHVGKATGNVGLLTGYASSSLYAMKTMHVQTNFKNLKTYNLYRSNGALNGNAHVSGSKFLKIARIANKVGVVGTAIGLSYDSYLGWKSGNPAYLNRAAIAGLTAFIPYVGFGISYGVSNSSINNFNWTRTRHTSSSGWRCFVAGTKILMSDGSFKTIENIVEGDKIKSVNMETMTIEDDIVQSIPTEVKKFKLVEMVLENGQVVKFSPSHPFWVIDKGWCIVDRNPLEGALPVKVSKLQEDDKILFYNRGKLTKVGISKIIITNKNVKMYNIDNVKNNHTFFANKILVHNKN